MKVSKEIQLGETSFTISKFFIPLYNCFFFSVYEAIFLSSWDPPSQVAPLKRLLFYSPLWVMSSFARPQQSNHNSENELLYFVENATGCQIELTRLKRLLKIDYETAPFTFFRDNVNENHFVTEREWTSCGGVVKN